jgi:hypothetical protein
MGDAKPVKTLVYSIDSDTTGQPYLEPSDSIVGLFSRGFSNLQALTVES